MYVKFDEASKLVGTEMQLLDQLKIGNITAEGRYFDFDAYGEDYEGCDYSRIPTFYWQDCEYDPAKDSLFHSQHLYGFHHIRLDTEQVSTTPVLKRNEGGRPKIIDSMRLYAEIAAALYDGKTQFPDFKSAAWRKELQVILPYLREFDNAELDTAKRSFYGPKTLDRELQTFHGHFKAALSQFQKDDEELGKS